jgi:hypothetical protein
LLFLKIPALIPGRAVGHRLVVLFVEDIKAQVSARVQESDRATFRGQLIDNIEEVFGQPLQLQILLHMGLLYGFGHHWNSFLHSPREADPDMQLEEYFCRHEDGSHLWRRHAAPSRSVNDLWTTLGEFSARLLVSLGLPLDLQLGMVRQGALEPQELAGHPVADEP